MRQTNFLLNITYLGIPIISLKNKEVVQLRPICSKCNIKVSHKAVHYPFKHCKQCNNKSINIIPIGAKHIIGTLPKAETIISDKKEAGKPIPKPKTYDLVVYAIEDRRTHKVYIGSTIYGAEYRLKQHIRAAIDGSNTKLHRLFRRYGCKTASDVDEYFITGIVYSLGNDISKEVNIRNLEIKAIRNFNSVKGGLNHYATFSEIEANVSETNIFKGLYVRDPSPYGSNTGNKYTTSGSKNQSHKHITKNAGVVFRDGKYIAQINHIHEVTGKKTTAQRTAPSLEEALVLRETLAIEFFNRGLMTQDSLAKYTAPWVL